MEDYKYQLSIVVPMYNSQKYIATCLDSILNSDLPKNKYEIIVVDDGSTDSGSEIVKGYMEFNRHITIISQENRGLSSARNTGLINSKGRYVWFVDSDDIVAEKLNHMLELIDMLKNVDIISSLMKHQVEENIWIDSEIRRTASFRHQILSGRDVLLKGYNPSSVCCLFIRKEFLCINNLYFMEGLTHQDVELNNRLYSYAKSVYFTDDITYVYIRHMDSISKSSRPESKIKYIKDNIYIAQSLENTSVNFKEKDQALSKLLHRKSKNVELGIVLQLYRNRKRWNKIGLNKEVLTAMRTERMYPLRGNFGSWKKNIVSRLLSIEFILT